ncbi:succinate dehydrogenase/fumarate reductase iron-sulfur subunit [Bdellovibrio sp. HCB209]|uniref:succinate dehydrogenase/fumarate reductase iron-sulfur subunit n=1 Tax=Bdellovibrio sp. HCB209 TaxID=3394354 RepID=UPI0039B3F0F4
MKLTFKVWRQSSNKAPGEFVSYPMNNVSADMSLLEALDILNDQLVLEKKPVIAFDHDCREGICGQCGMMVNGRAHGGGKNQTTCQIYLRSFNEGDEVLLEPFRANAFPVVQDLTVDRSAFDRIIQQGGYVTANTGTAPEANSVLIGKKQADKAMEMAACIGCGACVAACKNSSASLFTSAKINHFAALPQGAIESKERSITMVEQMDKEGFGHCSLTGACEAECPAEIPLRSIAEMNWRYTISRALK